MATLARLVSRGRALEILLVANDLDGPRAESYGYVNRLIAEDQLDGEVDQIASRLARGRIPSSCSAAPRLPARRSRPGQLGLEAW
jgi:enoyl-CoA hydratase/carnithine racemase